MGKIYVIRHGETDINIKGQINGRNDYPINDVGIKQAQEQCQKVSDLGIDLIICSPILRTKQTCEYVNIHKKPVIYDDRLMERDSKSMQYHCINELDFELWYDISKDVVYNDSEGFKSVCDRVWNFLDEVLEKYENKNILLVTHGDICKAIYLYFNNIDFKKIVEFEQQNCEIYEYDRK